MNKLICLLGFLFLSIFAFGQDVFINELDFKDTNKGVGIAGPAGTDLTDWDLHIITPAGDITNTIDLGGNVIDSESVDRGEIWVEVSMLVVPAGGVILLDDNGDVVQFLNYGSTPATISAEIGGINTTSFYVGNHETNESLQLTGEGCTYPEFINDPMGGWVAQSPKSHGNINANQTFDCESSSLSGGALPIELNYFRAKAQNNSVLVEWETSREENNAYVALERSADGVDFETIYREYATSDTDKESNYHYNDVAYSSGWNFYRLRQVDLDGNTTFYEVISVKMAKRTAILVYPTQALELVTVQTTEELDKDIVVYVYTLQGQLVWTGIFLTGTSELNIDVSTFRSGQYILKLDNSSEITVQRFIKL